MAAPKRRRRLPLPHTAQIISADAISGLKQIPFSYTARQGRRASSRYAIPRGLKARGSAYDFENRSNAPSTTDLRVGCHGQTCLPVLVTGGQAASGTQALARNFKVDATLEQTATTLSQLGTLRGLVQNRKLPAKSEILASKLGPIAQEHSDEQNDTAQYAHFTPSGRSNRLREAYRRASQRQHVSPLLTRSTAFSGGITARSVYHATSTITRETLCTVATSGSEVRP